MNRWNLSGTRENPFLRLGGTFRNVFGAWSDLTGSGNYCHRRWKSRSGRLRAEGLNSHWGRYHGETSGSAGICSHFGDCIRDQGIEEQEGSAGSVGECGDGPPPGATKADSGSVGDLAVSLRITSCRKFRQCGTGSPCSSNARVRGGSIKAGGAAKAKEAKAQDRPVDDR